MSDTRSHRPCDLFTRRWLRSSPKPHLEPSPPAKPYVSSVLERADDAEVAHICTVLIDQPR